MIAQGRVGYYLGEDPNDSHLVRLKVGNDVISINKTDVKEYRKMPVGEKYKIFMKKFKALMEKRMTLAEIEQLDKTGKTK